MKAFLFCLVLTALSSQFSRSLHAQPTIHWDKTIGGSANDQLVKVCATADGGHILAGTSNSPADRQKTAPKKGLLDYWLIKYAADGTKDWEKTIGGSQMSYLADIRQTTDGGYIVGGYSNSDKSGDKSENSRGGYDYWVVKLDSKGIKEWDKTVGGSGNETLVSAMQIADGSYILAGQSSSDASGEKTSDRLKSFDDSVRDFWIVKLSPAGAFESEKVVGYRHYGGLNAFEATKDGGYIYHVDEGATEYAYGQVHIVKLSGAMVVQWDKMYGYDGTYSSANTILQTSDNGYILAGFTFTDVGGRPFETIKSRDAYVIKIDVNGVQQWEQILGSLDETIDEQEELYSTYEDILTSVIQTPDGGYLVGGYSNGPAGAAKTENSRGKQDFWIFKMQSDGGLLWDKTIGGSNNDYLVSIAQASDGGYLLGGYSNSPISGEKTQDSQDTQNEYDFWTVKLASESPAFPGTITHFTAIPADNNVLVSWSSPKGSALKRFEIEQSTDGLSWKRVGTVNASSTKSDYEFTHQTPQTGVELYYRLKLIRSDNSFTYSKVRNATIISKAPAAKADYAYGGVFLEAVTAMIPTADGGYIYGGTQYSDPPRGDKSEPGRGENDYWIIKVGPDGLKEWDKTLGGSDYDNLSSIIPTSDGGYLVGGTSSSHASGDKSEDNKLPPPYYSTDYWIVKISANGTKQWDKTIGGSGDETLGSMQEVQDGYILAGVSNSGVGDDKSQDPLNQPGPYDFWLVKIDTNGSKIWDRVYPKYGANRVIFEKTDDGGYVLGSGAGYDYNNTSIYGFSIIKLSSEFNAEWTKDFTQSFTLESLQPTADQGYILGGYTNRNGDLDYWAMKLSSNGSIAWDKTVGGDRKDMLYSIRQAPDNGFILGGTTLSGVGRDKTEENKGIFDYWVVKLDADGNKQWDKSLGGSGFDILYSLNFTSDGDYLLGGTSGSEVGGDRTALTKGPNDFWIVRLARESPLPVTLMSFTARKENTASVLTWQTTSETNSDRFEIEHSINAKKWNSLGYLTANGESNALQSYQFTHSYPQNGDNYYRLKMVDADGTFTYSKVKRLKFDQSISVSVYPNPVTETIHLKAADWSKVKGLQILNSQGKTLYDAGNKPSQEISAKSFKPGLHFIKVTLTDGTEATRKIIVAQ